MNRGYYAGNYDPRTNYTSNYNNPINYQGQRNIGQIQNNFGQYGNNYRTTYPS